MKKITLFLAVFLLSLSLFSQSEIKTMFFNLLNYNSENKGTPITYPSRVRTPYLKTILDDYQPDIFMVSELVNEASAEYIKVNALNSIYTYTPFVNSGTGDNQLVFYNTNKLIYEKNVAIKTSLRDINHYTFKINTVDKDINPIYIEVFVAHLKSSNGSAERAQRLSEATIVTSYMDTYLPENSYVILAGDFNLYSSNEPAYQKLLDSSNKIELLDPINRSCIPFPESWTQASIDDEYKFRIENNLYFWRHETYKDVHTQSPRKASFGGGATGGLDDRFDYILISKNLKNGTVLTYQPNSYKSYGNNGNCYDISIIPENVGDFNCEGEYPLNIRSAIYYFSDHLPVVMKLELKSSTLSNASYTYNSLSFVSSNVSHSSIMLSIDEQLIRTDLVIYNQLGQAVKTINLNYQTVSNNQLTIDISQLSKGVYFINSNNYKLTSPLKFIKN